MNQLIWDQTETREPTTIQRLSS